MKTKAFLFHEIIENNLAKECYMMRLTCMQNKHFTDEFNWCSQSHRSCCYMKQRMEEILVFYGIKTCPSFCLSSFSEDYDQVVKTE